MRESAEEGKISTRQDLRRRICNCCCFHLPEACILVENYLVSKIKKSTCPTLLCLSQSRRFASLGNFLCCNVAACPLLPPHRFCTSCAVCNSKDFYWQVTSTDNIYHLLKRAGYSPTTVSCSHSLVPASSVTLGAGRKYRETAMRRWMLTPRARRRARGVKRRWVPRSSCRRMEWDVGGSRGRGSGASCMGGPCSSSSIGIYSNSLWESDRV